MECGGFRRFLELPAPDADIEKAAKTAGLQTGLTSGAPALEIAAPFQCVKRLEVSPDKRPAGIDYVTVLDCPVNRIEVCQLPLASKLQGGASPCKLG